MIRAYILRPTGKTETTARRLWDVISVHHGDRPPPHLGEIVMRQFLVVENFQLLDSTGIHEQLRAKRFTLADWPMLEYPYQAIRLEADGRVSQLARSLRFLNHDLLPAALRADALTIGKPLPIVDAAKVALTLGTRSKPAGTVTRGTGGILR